MLTYIIRRLLWIFLTMFFVSAVTFALIFVSPGDPALLLIGARPGFQRDETLVPQVRKRFSLNEQIHIQYLKYMSNVVRGEFGYSYFFKRPVAELLFEKLPNTALLAALILLTALLLGIPMGVLITVKQNSWIDQLYVIFGTVIISIPSFFLAELLIFLFAFTLRLFPIGGFGTPAHVVLPVLSVALPSSVGYALLLRTTMLTMLSTEYARTARAKGLRERLVALRHVLPNALIPIATTVALDLAVYMTGIVLVETIFSWPGIGLAASRAAIQKDVPVIMGSVLFASLLIGLGNLLADLFAARLDPRITLR